MYLPLLWAEWGQRCLQHFFSWMEPHCANKLLSVYLCWVFMSLSVECAGSGDGNTKELSSKTVRVTWISVETIILPKIFQLLESYSGKCWNIELVTDDRTSRVVVIFMVKAEFFGDIMRIGCKKLWNRFWLTVNLSMQEADTDHTSRGQSWVHGNTPAQTLIIWNLVNTDVVQKCWKYVYKVAMFNITKKIITKKQHNVVWKSSGQYGWNFTAGLYQLELMSDSRALSHFPPSHCQQPAEHLLSKIHPANYALILEPPISARLQLRLSRLLQPEQMRLQIEM